MAPVKTSATVVVKSGAVPQSPPAHTIEYTLALSLVFHVTGPRLNVQLEGVAIVWMVCVPIKARHTSPFDTPLGMVGVKLSTADPPESLPA